jgi:hypothetical protein
MLVDVTVTGWLMFEQNGSYRLINGSDNESKLIFLGDMTR